jgi:autotransporter-associated beta strand protein
MIPQFKLIAGIAVLFAVGGLHAANISLTADDGSGTSSFNSTGHWSNGAAPDATNNYFTSTWLLRSPADSSSYTFGGGSLSIDLGGRFLMKGTGGQIVTVTNLIMNGGLADYANSDADNNMKILAGRITLATGTTSYFGAVSGIGSETLIITAPIQGGGNIQIAGPAVNGGSDNGTVQFAGTNTYTGNTTVAGGTLALSGNGSLVSSNISVSTGATLDVSGQNSPVLAVGQSLFGGGSIKGNLTTAIKCGIYPGTNGAAGMLTLNNSLTMAVGSTLNLDLSTSGTSGNDLLNVTGALTLNGNTLNLHSLSGSASLDASTDYVLATAGSISGSPNPTVNWVGTPPANAAGFTLLVTGTQLKLHYGVQSLFAVGQAAPANVLANQSALLKVMVTPAAAPASTGIAVTANLISIGGSASQIFYDDGTHGDETPGNNVFSFNATVAVNTSQGLQTMAVSVTDAQARSVAAQIALTVLSGQYNSAPFLPVSDAAAPGAFPVAAGGVTAPIYYSTNDANVVGIAARALRDDVQRVTGLTPTISSNSPTASANAVFIGTVGESTLIDGLIAAGKIDVGAIQGQWESYTVTTVTNPMAGVDQALVIAGSDRRGTVFGVFGLSEAMGVSPWYWFGDVPTAQKSSIYVGSGVYTEPSPGVKYRGIFINDEDWGMEPWARLTFDPAGDIGPTTYAHIYELLLRLHANYIWPAMHPVTEAYYTIPGNKEVADDYAIVVGTSHHEPMQRNTDEYDPNVLGAYNYWTNQMVISNFWDQRVLELTNSENVYTIGMRGLTDDGIIAPAGTTTQQKADELQNVIIPDQRAIIAKHLNPDPSKVPQVFVPYKEALTLYQTGMQLPDDITLVWPDDNHGYIRELSTTTENLRRGGSGVYYHLSYWGVPANYLWLCTTPPAMTWSEMSKAWDYNASRMWIVNVGDLKPTEIGMEFFLRLARNPEAFRNFDQHAYLAQWAARTFGLEQAGAIASVLDEYYRLNIIVRPEHLNRTTSGFNFVANGDEAQKRLDDFNALVSSANTIYAQLPAAQKAAFYEMILYPIRGSKLVNEKVLQAERSRLWATQGRAATATMAAEAQAAQNALLAETAYFNQTNAGGKWNRMMTVDTNGANNAPYLMPTLGSYSPPSTAGLGVAVEGFAAVLTVGTPGLLPTFNPVANESHFIDIFNTGTSPMPWIAQSSEPWIVLSQTNGTADGRIWVSINWAQAPQGEAVTGWVSIQGAGTARTVYVKVFSPAWLNPGTLPSAVENNGVVNIEAENFNSVHDSAGGVGWRKISQATASHDGMTIFPTTAASIDPGAITADTPSLTCQFYTFSAGPAVIQTACLPTHFISSEHPGCRYAISVNGDTPQVVDISALEFTSPWYANVVRATAYGTTTHTITNAGLQSLKVWMIDPGVVLDKFTVNLKFGPVFEAESLDLTTPSAYHTFGDGSASGGVMLSLDANAVGQYIIVTVPGVAAGIYDLAVRSKTWNNRGIAQVSIGDSVSGPFANIGSPLDFYSANVTYTNVPPAIRFTNSIAGTKYFKFTVTGRNPSSSGYLIVLDSLTLTPTVVPATASTPQPLSMSVIGYNLNLTWPGGLGWRLQVQTNLLSKGLGTNWIYVTDGLIFSTNIMTDPGTPATFYRLSHP